MNARQTMHVTDRRQRQRADSTALSPGTASTDSVRRPAWAAAVDPTWPCTRDEDVSGLTAISVQVDQSCSILAMAGDGASAPSGLRTRTHAAS